MDAVYDLLDDTKELLGISTAGDIALVKQLSPDILMNVLDEFRSHLLRSTEAGCWSHFVPVVQLHPDQTTNSRLIRSFQYFLKGAIEMIFDIRRGGRMLPFPSIAAFRCIYQVSAFTEKFGSSKVTDTMKSNAIRQYLSDEESVKSLSLEGNGKLLEYSKHLLCRYMLKYYQPPKVTGRHGPGAVSEGSVPFWSKYRFNPHEDLDTHWPDVRLNNPLKTNFTGTGRPRMSRLCFVPKSRKKCRIICAEPALLQYLQQGQRAPLYRAIKLSPLDLDLSDQTVNGTVAKEASELCNYATIDLRSASDLLSLDLVGAIFPTPLFAKFAACRSTETAVFSDSSTTIIPLLKFGSMGNALTFPVQTMVFWSLVCAARVIAGDREMDAVLDTWIYGDDIISPTNSIQPVMEALSSCGLSVNKDKSFWRGQFRESCGVHAFAGHDVTPAYCRTWSPDPESLVSINATARLLDRNGFKRAAERCYNYIESSLDIRLPYSRRAEGLARYIPDDYHEYDISELNISLGHSVKRDRYHRLVVPSLGLRENATKRRRAVFDNSWDLWDHIGPTSLYDWAGAVSDRDRGVIAGGVSLIQVALPLA